MSKGFFYKLGIATYRFRWVCVSLWLLVVLSCLPFTTQLFQPFKIIGFIDYHSESAKANDLLNERLNYTSNSLLILYQSQTKNIDSPKNLRAIQQSLSDFSELKIKHKILYPTTSQQIAKDKTVAYAVVLLQDKVLSNDQLATEIKRLIKPPKNLKVLLGGMPIFLEDTKARTQSDLFRSEYIATPVAIITMLLVFGSVVAASLPIIIGGIDALLILTILFFIGRHATLSVFTINIAILLGLCLSLDYALFIVSRFRDELKRSNNIGVVIGNTLATAGKAVFFSGLAVFASLGALLLFKVNILYSIGIGGLIAVIISVLTALTLLPSVLGIISTHINSLALFNFTNQADENTIWYKLSRMVVHHPYTFFIIILLILGILSYPLLHIHIGNSDFRILPNQMQSRQSFNTFNEKFGENDLYPIYILITSDTKRILNKKNINDLYDFNQALKKHSSVTKVESIFSLDPNYTKQQYQMLYSLPAKQYPAPIQQFLKLNTKKNLTVMTAISKYAIDTPKSKQLIQDIRRLPLPAGLHLQLTGNYINSMDVLESISATFPYALLWVFCSSYFILLLLLRSVFLPLKAIVMNVLSLAASFGVLVYTIQMGHLQLVLHFQQQGILDISLLIIIFCALFGISMDYEVFLLTRIKEYYERTQNNNDSIVFGIVKSSRIITSAAAIIILICFAFMTAQIIIVKAVGLGIAAAVFIDAFLVRTMLVPATMVIMAKWNWYLPRWLERLLPNVNFDINQDDSHQV